MPARRLHEDELTGSDPEDDGGLVLSGGLEEAEAGERQAQPGGGHSRQREPSCEEASGSSIGSIGADPDVRTLGR
jgi:hypothetical protein